jgi:hypothetical protein
VANDPHVVLMSIDFEKANEIYFRLGIIYKHQRKYSSSLEVSIDASVACAGLTDSASGTSLTTRLDHSPILIYGSSWATSTSRIAM